MGKPIASWLGERRVVQPFSAPRSSAYRGAHRGCSAVQPVRRFGTRAVVVRCCGGWFANVHLCACTSAAGLVVGSFSATQWFLRCFTRHQRVDNEKPAAVLQFSAASQGTRDDNGTRLHGSPRRLPFVCTTASCLTLLRPTTRKAALALSFIGAATAASDPRRERASLSLQRVGWCVTTGVASGFPGKGNTWHLFLKPNLSVCDLSRGERAQPSPGIVHLRRFTCDRLRCSGSHEIIATARTALINYQCATDVWTQRCKLCLQLTTTCQRLAIRCADACIVCSTWPVASAAALRKSASIYVLVTRGQTGFRQSIVYYVHLIWPLAIRFLVASLVLERSHPWQALTGAWPQTCRDLHGDMDTERGRGRSQRL